jgi:glyoxylase-like metal-dependent hydrolase (beta-lactamase superfamily II)
VLRVLLEGLHTNHHGEGFYDIDPLTSSATLIQKDSQNILIDTGTPKFFPIIKKKLAEHGLKPEDIHYIFNTHFHLDHCGNDAFFPNAFVWVGRSNLDYKTGRARVFTDTSKIKYPAGIKPLFTPGHTADHTAYLYEENNVKYVCSGDALREDTIRSQCIPRCHFPEKFVPSMKMIFEAADVIIPGHGRVISGELKKELYGLICGEWKTP